ncbi:aminoglycoside phosphotransferase family protein [Microbacterium yannicii]|uniref:Aminoglycoside phosphotransferase family protein n=1 Tax=Microbacterium yannicii TaxID=671622 RepID=A0ABP9M717_9MICO|nr:aminoglycoside phosphotransferase family protein [Microbacterium yannicii]MCO5952446.1 aminoglycoside phosphotransferase family protein [Microbacterium yannicii]
MMTAEARAGDELRDLALSALRRAGLLGAEPPTVEPLAGGVSNDVLMVRTAQSAFVVKRALPRLRVAEVWEASAERSYTEAAALRWAHGVAPDAVPGVVTVDRENNVLVIELAPDGYGDWKQQLLAGDVRPDVGTRLGALLAGWHVASASDADVLAEFNDQEAFGQLRVKPFYTVAAERNPEAAPVIATLVERMAGTRVALVHGDFSPKNVLAQPADGGGLWVIDWEVAHTGDPVFDVAFLLHHLICKIIVRPDRRHELMTTAENFVQSYSDRTRTAFRDLDHRYLLAHAGALVLARVDGKSPVDYFSTAQRDEARALALDVLREAPDGLAELWRMTSV